MNLQFSFICQNFIVKMSNFSAVENNIVYFVVSTELFRSHALSFVTDDYLLTIQRNAISFVVINSLIQNLLLLYTYVALI